MHWSPESDSPSLLVPLSREVREDLSWCMVRNHLLMGVRFGTPAPDLHLYSDASRSGWGTHLLDRGVVGAEVAAHQSSQNEGIVSGVAVISGVGRRSPGDRDVRQLDGCGLHQQAGRDGFSFPLLVGQPASKVDRESRHPPRCQVSSREAQCSGRSPQSSDQVIGTEWSLHPRVVRDLLRRWGSPSIDLFAMSYNMKLPL